MKSLLKNVLKAVAAATFVAVMVWTRPPTPSDAGTPFNKPGSGEPSPGAHSQFRAAYQNEMRKVAATADPFDDLQLAGRMHDHASRDSTDAGLIVILCDNAYTLASRVSQGDALAVKVMALLAKRVPTQVDAAQLHIIELYERRFKLARDFGAKRKQHSTEPGIKETHGRRLLKELLVLVDRKIRNHEYTSASRFATKAQRVAEKLRWPELLDGIEARQALIRDRRKAQTRLAIFSKRLDENPWDAKSLTEVIRLHVVELNDAGSAQTYLRKGGTKTADQLVPLLIHSIETLAPNQAAAMAQWLYRQAKVADTTVTGQVQTLTKAKTLYLHFLEKQVKHDSQLKQSGKTSEQSAVQTKESKPTKNSEPKLSFASDQFAEVPVNRVRDAIADIDRQLLRLTAPLHIRAFSRGRTVTLHWAAGETVDLYHNGKPLKPYLPNFRARKADSREINTVKIILKQSDVFTAGMKMNGAGQGLLLVAVGDTGRVLWHTSVEHWKGYTAADAKHWYMPQLAIRSKPYEVSAKKGYTREQQQLVDQFGKGIVSVKAIDGEVTYLFSIVRSLDPSFDLAMKRLRKPARSAINTAVQQGEKQTRDVSSSALGSVPTRRSVRNLPVLGD